MSADFHNVRISFGWNKIRRLSNISMEELLWLQTENLFLLNFLRYFIRQASRKKQIFEILMAIVFLKHYFSGTGTRKSFLYALFKIKNFFCLLAAALLSSLSFVKVLYVFKRYKTRI